MKNISKFALVTVGVCAPVAAFAQTAVEDMATAVETTAGSIATAAVGIVLAGLAIFAIRWGVKKVKSTLSASA